jgi:hypothetical protein
VRKIIIAITKSLFPVVNAFILLFSATAICEALCAPCIQAALENTSVLPQLFFTTDMPCPAVILLFSATAICEPQSSVSLRNLHTLMNSFAAAELLAPLLLDCIIGVGL